MVRFTDRADAGRRLGEALRQDPRLTGPGTVVLGLPRGGVPVALEVAEALGAPLDVILVRKLGLPYQPELAMGAIGEDRVRVTNEPVIRAARITQSEIRDVEERERAELERRSRMLRGDLPRLPLAGRTAVVVDDGVATGATARAACEVARAHGAARVVLAVPVGAPDSLAGLRTAADEVVCLEAPTWMSAVGQGYRHFGQVSDREVLRCLRAGRRAVSGPVDEEVEVVAGSATLAGHLTVPAHPVGMVVFAHGSGSSRHSARNRHVAQVLHTAGLGTLLFDLLTEREEHDRRLVFDVGLLAGRLVAVTAWLRDRPAGAALPVGYFGASTGAAAAIVAATDPAARVRAVVSRGGRPDLAGAALTALRVPVLLLVGGRDTAVLDLNRHAQDLLRCENDLVVVPGATHLFEEPGTLDVVAGLARAWFLEHLAGTADRQPPVPTQEAR